MGAAVLPAPAPAPLAYGSASVAVHQSTVPSQMSFDPRDAAHGARVRVVQPVQLDGPVHLRQILGGGGRRPDEPVGDDAQGQLAAGAQQLQRCPRRLVHGHVAHARVARRHVGVDGDAHGGRALLERVHAREERPHELEDGRLAEQPRGPALGVAPHDAAGGIVGREGVDAELAQRGAVAPRRVQVLGVDVHGPAVVGEGGVEGGGVGAAVRHGRQPAAAEDAGELGVLGRVPPHGAQDVVEVGAALEVELLQGEPEVQQVHVPVDEARQHLAAAQVLDGAAGIALADGGRLRAGVPHDAVGDDEAAVHKAGELGVGLVGDQDAAVPEDAAGPNGRTRDV